MLKAFITYTDEIDDAGLALADIQAQMGSYYPEEGATLGILSCHEEFVHTGVAESVVKAMPFPVVGMTSMCVGAGPVPAGDTNRAEGELRLTMMVISGDELRFELIGSGPVSEDTDVQELAQRMLSGRGTPALLLAFTPDYSTVSCDALCQAVSRALPGVPMFGGVGVDNSPLYNEDCYVITPDGPKKGELVMVTIYGAATPEFFTASVPADKVMGQAWRITDSDKACLRMVDGNPVTEFLKSFGLTRSLAEDGALSGLSLIVKEPGKSPYSRTMLALDKHGDLACGGWMPGGSEIRMARFEKNAMLSAAMALLESALNGPRRPTALVVWCCATRAAVLGDDNLAEIRLLREFAGDIPFMFAYAGGEICPGLGDDGNLYNQFHNQSFTLCAVY
ncbi:MAG: FIST C-terminal domain-containing protein [Oscillospiraceae bacterium]|jgi:hypothetical protein|nr:FIST C-terminal domain-containing protein [Oscillospiraceae bacterium]